MELLTCTCKNCLNEARYDIAPIKKISSTLYLTEEERHQAKIERHKRYKERAKRLYYPLSEGYRGWTT